MSHNVVVVGVCVGGGARGSHPPPPHTFHIGGAEPLHFCAVVSKLVEDSVKLSLVVNITQA